MKKIICTITILLFILFLFGACVQRDDIFILKRKIEQKGVISLNTVTISYKDDYVTKQVIEEEYQSINEDTNELLGYKENAEYVYNQDMFKLDGFKFSTELTETTLKVITTIDYTKIKNNDLSNDAKRFFFVEDIVDENGEMPIDELIDYYVEENGFAIYDAET